MADKTFDPRFDPAFQRGYAAGERGDRADAAEPAVAPGPVMTVPPSAAHEPSSSQSDYVDDAGAPAGSGAATARTSLARNPWIYVLWGLGATGIAASLMALRWANSILYGISNGAIESYAMVANVQSLAPIGFSFGSFSLVGALLLHGLNWMRKNP